jgi:hypothetical protein
MPTNRSKQSRKLIQFACRETHTRKSHDKPSGYSAVSRVCTPLSASVTIYTYFQGCSIHCTYFCYPEATALAGGETLDTAELQGRLGRGPEAAVRRLFSPQKSDI